MKNKYYVKISREALRCDSNGNLSKLCHTQEFGNKSKNKFITTTDFDNQIKICTPNCENEKECYIKLEQLTDIVLLSLHNRNEILWPSSKPCLCSNIISNITINFELSQQGYDELKLKESYIPNTIEEAYEKINKNIKLEKELLNKIYGDLQIKLVNKGLEISNISLDIFEKCGISCDNLSLIIAIIFKCLLDKDNLENVSKKLGIKYNKDLEEIISNNLIYKMEKLESNEIVEISKKHMENGYNERYRLKHYPKLLAEAAIFIKDALSQGIDYKILNEETSFVEVNDNGHKEFVIEGNRTDRDSYIFPIVTDDKLVAKTIMEENGLSVPKAILLQKDMSEEEINDLLAPVFNEALVVKPRNTNMGTGITVFKTPTSKEKLLTAIEYAFKYDKDVLIEEYAKGMEYRFLVVDGKCLSVAHRRAASVVGNGKSTIKELIEEKNKEPWHALTGTPVKMEEPVEVYLKHQGYTYDSVLENQKRIFLRTNSNCSTGGESIDMTEKMPEFFKRISEKAANVFNAKVSGVDIIIDDLNLNNYYIIEINDDPGYSINEWPYEGNGEKIGIGILKMLGYLKEE